MPRISNTIAKEDYSAVTKALIKVRKAYGFSRKDSAEAIFVSYQLIRDMELGITITKTSLHHIWMMYSDYLFDLNKDKCLTLEEYTDIQHSLDIIGKALYGEEY